MCCAGRLLTALRGDQDIVNCVAAHPTQPLLASCGLDATLKLWRPCFGGAPWPWCAVMVVLVMVVVCCVVQWSADANGPPGTCQENECTSDV